MSIYWTRKQPSLWDQLCHMHLTLHRLMNFSTQVKTILTLIIHMHTHTLASYSHQVLPQWENQTAFKLCYCLSTVVTSPNQNDLLAIQLADFARGDTRLDNNDLFGLKVYEFLQLLLTLHVCISRYTCFNTSSCSASSLGVCIFIFCTTCVLVHIAVLIIAYNYQLNSG